MDVASPAPVGFVKSVATIATVFKKKCSKVQPYSVKRLGHVATKQQNNAYFFWLTWLFEGNS